jgi:hypothetical protein
MKILRGSSPSGLVFFMTLNSNGIYNQAICSRLALGHWPYKDIYPVEEIRASTACTS